MTLFGNRTELALVGYELPGSENLSIRILASAMEQKGICTHIVTSPGMGHSSSLIKKLVRSNPLIIGLSLQDSISAIHSLALATLARKHGFKGYVVCGGSFATLNTKWVLDNCSAVNGVIRHNGEIPLFQLVNSLKNSNSIANVPSLVTREFENPIHAEAAEPTWRPIRAKRSTVMGVPIADVIGGRGCSEKCDYCTHFAVASLVTREIRDAGVSPEGLKKAGLGTSISRPLADLADEMADLYHDDGVRYFYLVDENPVPKNEAAALDWAGTLKEQFNKREMDKAALGFMTRGDRMTPKLVDALYSLGLVKTLVGLESGTKSGLKNIGRISDLEKGINGMNLLAKKGILTHFNSLMLHSESTIQSIGNELDFLDTVKDALFDSVQVRPFFGTRLNRRIDAEGSLTGGVLVPSFHMKNQAVERFRSLHSRYSTTVLGEYTPSFRLNDLIFSSTLARKSGDSRRLAQYLTGDLHSMINKVNSTRIKALKEILKLAVTGENTDSAFYRFGKEMSEIHSTLDDLEGNLNSENGDATIARTCKNIAAAASLIFTISSSSGCYQAEPVNEEISETSDSMEDTDIDSSTSSQSDDQYDDTASSEDSEIYQDSEEDTDSNGCSVTIAENQFTDLENMVLSNCDFNYSFDSVFVTLDESGQVEKVEIDYTWSDVDSALIEECYSEILKDETFPCLAGEDIWINQGLMGIIE